MNIKWIGHSCFLITAASGASLLTDPYDVDAYPGQLLYQPVDETADVLTVSHLHSDHGNIEAVGGTPLVIRAAGPHQAGDFSVKGVPTYHDTEAGAHRGDNIVFVISVDGLVVCHLGDLGHELNPEQAEAIGQVDVLLIPVGGNFTIDAATATRVWQQLNPAVTVPMHFRNEKCRFAIDGVEPFIAGKHGVEVTGSPLLEVTQENLPASPKIVVLDPAN